MADFAVLEAGDGLARRLEARFGTGMDAGDRPGLLILSPRVHRLQWEGTLHCTTVLLPGSAGSLLSHIKASSAVSYGMSGRDSVTLSSRVGQRLCVSLQRELVRLDGVVLERQEIITQASRNLGTMHALALVASLLILGVSTQELDELYLQ